MTKLNAKIKELHRKRKELAELNMKVRGNRAAKDIKQFYEDSLDLVNVGKGITIMISPDEEYREFTDLSFDDKKAARRMIHRSFGDKVDFKDEKKDYRDIVTQDYNCVLICMKSIIGKEPSEIFIPENCNAYQLDRIKQFNQEIKDFNDGHTPSCCVRLHYDGLGDSIARNLDGLIKSIDSEEKAPTK